MSRPLALTIDIIGAIEEKVLECVHPEVAARQLGVSRARFMAWMKDGEAAYENDVPNTHPAYLSRVLFERIEEAEAQAEQDLIAKIFEHASSGKSTWTAFLFVLERRFADRWRKREMVGDAKESIDSQIRQSLEAAGVRVRAGRPDLKSA